MTPKQTELMSSETFGRNHARKDTRQREPNAGSEEGGSK